MTILCAFGTRVKAPRRAPRPFAAGLERPRLPVGPAPEDARWWAEVSNRGTRQYVTADEEDDFKCRWTISALAYHTELMEAAAERIGRSGREVAR